MYFRSEFLIKTGWLKILEMVANHACPAILSTDLSAEAGPPRVCEAKAEAGPPVGRRRRTGASAGYAAL